MHSHPDLWPVVAVQQKVKVTVMEVDVPRKRIALSLKSDQFGAGTIIKEKSETSSAEGGEYGR